MTTIAVEPDAGTVRPPAGMDVARRRTRLALRAAALALGVGTLGITGSAVGLPRLTPHTVSPPVVVDLSAVPLLGSNLRIRLGAPPACGARPCSGQPS